LVLQAVAIPHRIVTSSDGQFMLAVPAAVAEKAKHEIWEYEQENQASKGKRNVIAPNYEKSVPGVIGYLIVVVLVAWLAETAALGRDWFAAGRIDGVLLRNGEWWRAVTALTLHSDLKHILGNMVFGAFFGILAGGLIGPGIAWLAILVSAALANTLNVFLLDEGHRAIGASTAVFAALGLVSGFVWRSKLMAQEKWAWRLGPIVGGLALLAYTGTGGPNTDVGAHLAGFVCGFGSGMLVTRLSDASNDKRLQLVSGLLALGIVFVAWTNAFQL
jgi:rhomboid protease GluP